MGPPRLHAQPCSAAEGSRSMRLHTAGMPVALACSWMLGLLLLQGPSHVAAQNAPVTTGPIVINELLASPANDSRTTPTSWADVTSSVEWFELHNKGNAAVDISGWTASEGPQGGATWKFPSGISIPAGGFLVVLCPRVNDALPAVPADSNVLAASDIKVNRDGIYLYDGSNKLVASTGGRLPEQRSGVTFGIPAGAASGNSSYTFLQRPTPFLANTGPLSVAGPFIHSMRRSGPSSPIVVETTLSANQAPIARATLLYRVNYGEEQQIAMTPAGTDNNGRVRYSASIPETAFKPGDMVRWRVQAADTAGGTSLEPNGLEPGAKQYEGTVIPVPDEASSPIPVLYWWAQDVNAATSQQGSPSSLSFNGDFYDNVFANKRGVTALSWPKPKMNFRVDGGFKILPNIPAVNELKLNSYWFELGENSFMKEVVAYQVMRDEGVIASESFHVAVYLNGQFYGLYGMIEEVDSNILEHYDLPRKGAFFKSESGELSNLRWDLPISEMPAYYSKPTRKEFTGDWQLLADFTKGLAGGGPGTRTSYLFDNLNIPAVINEAAVNTLLANMDRCTKNFYVYYNPDTAEWIRIPWDVEASMGQDNTLGGRPGDLYCILACEQWNSPLYCDSEHPQDLGNIQTAWGLITAVGLNPYQGAAVQSSGRKLAQALPAEGNKPLTFKQPDDWNNPDRVQYGTKSVIGAPGTYNHLTDAILDANATRAMYMRRLRNLADTYYGGNRLRQIVDATWSKIQSVAARDNQIWQRGDGTRGYTQLTTEFIPIRGKQLLQTYASGGQNPLLPGSQRSSSDITLGFGPRELTSDTSTSYISFIVTSPGGEAVDISGWKISRQGGGSFTFPAGTVLVPGKPLHLTSNLKGFRGRSNSPKAGDAAFVLQAPGNLLPTDGSTGAWSFVDGSGSNIKLE